LAVPGEIGCYASHLLAWERCVEVNQPIAVLEDDFVLADHFPDALARAGKLSADFPFIRLEKASPKPHYTVHRDGGYKLIKYLKIPQCLTCYVISPEAARALIDASEKFVYPVDVFVRNQHLHRVPVYGLQPFSAAPRGTDSVIGDRHSQKVSPQLRASRVRRRLVNAALNIATNGEHLWRRIRHQQFCSRLTGYPAPRPGERRV
jgi:glycosyl transferase, family 25